jgi:hypothetical protein
MPTNQSLLAMGTSVSVFDRSLPSKADESAGLARGWDWGLHMLSPGVQEYLLLHAQLVNGDGVCRLATLSEHV